MKIITENQFTKAAFFSMLKENNTAKDISEQNDIIILDGDLGFFYIIRKSEMVSVFELSAFEAFIHLQKFAFNKRKEREELLKYIKRGCFLVGGTFPKEISEKEKLILGLMFEGLTVKTISNLTKLSEKRVSAHKISALNKFGERRISDLVYRYQYFKFFYERISIDTLSLK
ncbi:LuxR C-terminal-related transcriptional regulator [Klebsiella aerogenes]